MKKTDIKRIYDARAMYADQEVTVAGWVRSVRNSKTFARVLMAFRLFLSKTKSQITRRFQSFWRAQALLLLVY